MLNDGDKGAVLQRDGRTFAISPHLPCGLVEPAMLRRIADVAEHFGGQLKCTSAQRIAIIGLREDQIDEAWQMLGGERPGCMTGCRVRSARACPGSSFCKRGRQDSLSFGLELDRKYHGRPTPGITKIGVSGCGNQCSETEIKDIGLVGGATGWTILVGGHGGSTARLAKQLTDSEVSTDRAKQIVEKIFNFMDAHSQAGERLGETLQRTGMLALRQVIG